ncbi:fibrobacter succinogenes major paralogous domain-containing protein [Fulvivirgaceae bacterium LMO-SS25]
MRLFFTKRAANQKIARAKSSLWLTLIFALLIVGCNPEDPTETEPTAELGTLKIADLSVNIYSNAAASSNARVEAFSTWEHIFEEEVTLYMENVATSVVYDITFNPNGLDNTVNITLPYGFYRYTLDTDPGGEMEDFLPFTAEGIFEITEEEFELEIEGETTYGLVTLTNFLVTSAELTSDTQTQALALTDDELHYYKYVIEDIEVTLDIEESYSGTSLTEVIDEVESYRHYHYYILAPDESLVTFSISMGIFDLQETILEIGRVRDIDGNSYRIAKIGDQVWMAENLNASKFRNGDDIPYASTEAEWLDAAANGTPAYCYYNDDPANGDTFGKLYNWHAVNDPRGLAPDGYHIPNEIEFNILETFLGDNPGGKLKETGTGLWISPNTDATNYYGFSGLPAGQRLESGQFRYIGQHTHFWTSSLESSTHGKRVGFSYDSGDLVYGPRAIGAGFSVRAIRD